MKEEYELLQELIRDDIDFINNGSSRAVFKFDTNRVVKVAMDRQGRRQNKNEIDLFRIAGNDYLAEIYAYGRFLLVMEEVSAQPMEDMLDVFYENQFFDYEDREIERVSEVIDFLSEHTGETDDNFQLGWSLKRNLLVSYDYGYNTEHRNRDLVSNNLCDHIYMEGPESILEKSSNKLKKILDRYAKI
jgi:hypothetical protein